MHGRTQISPLAASVGTLRTVLGIIAATDDVEANLMDWDRYRSRMLRAHADVDGVVMPVMPVMPVAPATSRATTSLS